MVRSKIWQARSEHQKAVGRTTQNFVSYAKTKTVKRKQFLVRRVPSSAHLILRKSSIKVPLNDVSNYMKNIAWLKIFKFFGAKIMSGSVRKRCGGKFFSQKFVQLPCERRLRKVHEAFQVAFWVSRSSCVLSIEHSVIQRSALCQTLRVFCCRWNVPPPRLVFFPQELHHLHSTRKNAIKRRIIINSCE